MDVPRVLDFLRLQRESLGERFVTDSFGLGDWRLIFPREVAEAAQRRAELVLDRVTPRWRATAVIGIESEFDGMRQAITRAIAELEVREELDEMLGDTAPGLSAGTFHAWVWDSAKNLWSSGHYREAVSAAARAINAQVQAKTSRRDISEWKLLTNAFSAKPPEPGEPRLRLMKDDGSDTFRNVHEGAGSFARGLYQAIRNPANHDELGELSETEALEQLAAFSVLARWVDEATVER